MNNNHELGNSNSNRDNCLCWLSTLLVIGKETSDTKATNYWPNIMSNVKIFVVSNATSPKIDDSALCILLQL